MLHGSGAHSHNKVKEGKLKRKATCDIYITGPHVNIVYNYVALCVKLFFKYYRFKFINIINTVDLLIYTNILLCNKFNYIN